MTFDIVQNGTVLLSPREGVMVRFMLPVGVTLSEQGIVNSERFSTIHQEIEVMSIREGMNIHAIRKGDSQAHRAEDNTFHYDEKSGVVIPVAYGNLCLVPRDRKNK